MYTYIGTVIRTAMVVAYKNHVIIKHVHYYYDYCPNILNRSEKNEHTCSIQNNDTSDKHFTN